MFRLLACLLLVVCCTRPAFAEPTKEVQVLAVMSDATHEQAQALTIALKRVAERDKRWKLARGDFSLEVMVTAMDCRVPPNAECLKKIGQKLKAERFIWGIMRKAGADVVTKLELWENGRTLAETSLRYNANLSDASDDVLLEIARNGFWSLVGMPAGTLLLTAGNVTGDVLVDGEGAGKVTRGSAALALSAGKHQVMVRAAGYTESAASVTIRPEASTELVLKPARKQADEIESEPLTDKSAGRPSGAQRTIGYVALGFGGLMATGGVYSMIRVDAINGESGFERYRQGLRSNQDVCDEADKGTLVPGASSPSDVANQCGTARTFQTLQYVFFGASAASVLTGTLLLITDSSSERQPGRMRVAPRVALGPRGGQVDVRLTF